MKKLLLIAALLLGITSLAYAADVTLKWDESANATGYKIYQSVDNGNSWDSGTDVGDVLTYTLSGVPDRGLVLFKISAYNSQGEAIRSWSGAWYNGSWKLDDPSGAGVE